MSEEIKIIIFLFANLFIISIFAILYLYSTIEYKRLYGLRGQIRLIVLPTIALWLLVLFILVSIIFVIIH